MNKIILILLTLSSVSAFADCNILIQNTNITPKQIMILKNRLENKGFSIVGNQSDARYLIDVNAEAQSISNSIWKAHAEIYNTKGQMLGNTINGNDLAISMPVHILTLSFGTLAPTKGTFAIRRVASKLPSCDELEENLKH